MKITNVAIDGPSGSGKSTLSRKAAENLGFIYVDTGAMYRTIGLYAYRLGIPVDSVEPITEHLSEISISLKYQNGEQLIFLGEEDVSKEIRTHIISSYASAVAKIPAVRAFLLVNLKGRLYRLPNRQLPLGYRGNLLLLHVFFCLSHF